MRVCPWTMRAHGCAAPTPADYCAADVLARNCPADCGPIAPAPAPSPAQRSSRSVGAPAGVLANGGSCCARACVRLCPESAIAAACTSARGAEADSPAVTAPTQASAQAAALALRSRVGGCADCEAACEPAPLGAGAAGHGGAQPLVALAAGAVSNAALCCAHPCARCVARLATTTSRAAPAAAACVAAAAEADARGATVTTVTALEESTRPPPARLARPSRWHRLNVLLLHTAMAPVPFALEVGGCYALILIVLHLGCAAACAAAGSARESHARARAHAREHAAARAGARRPGAQGAGRCGVDALSVGGCGIVGGYTRLASRRGDGPSGGDAYGGPDGGGGYRGGYGGYGNISVANPLPPVRAVPDGAQAGAPGHAAGAPLRAVCWPLDALAAEPELGRVESSAADQPAANARPTADDGAPSQCRASAASASEQRAPALAEQPLIWRVSRDDLGVGAAGDSGVASAHGRAQPPPAIRR